MPRNQLIIVTTSLLQSWFRLRPTGCCCRLLTNSMVHAVTNDHHATKYEKNRIVELRRKVLPVSTVPYRSQRLYSCKTNDIPNKTSCSTLQRYLSQISTVVIQNDRWNKLSLSLTNTLSRTSATSIRPTVSASKRLSTKTLDVTLFPSSAPRSSSIQQQQQQQQIRTVHTTNSNVTTVNSRQHHQYPKQDNQEQFVSIWERTKSFSSNVYKIYQDYQLYKNISQTSQTAIMNLFHLLYQHHNNNNTTTTTMHSWTQRIHQLRCNSIQNATTTTNQFLWNDSKLPVSTLSEFLLQYCNDNNTRQTTKGRNLYNIIIPYSQQQQQYQLILAVQKVLPTIIGFLIPIIGYVPMLLSILFPKQFLCRHFYNAYEIFHYNTQFYQQQYQYYPNVVRHIIQHQQPSSSDPIHVLQTISNQWRRDETIFDLLLFGSDNHHPTTDTSHHPTTQQKQQEQEQSLSFALPPLHTFSREQLIDLSLSCNGNGIYSILPSTVNLYLTKYCTPTWYLQRFLSSTIQTLIHFDLLLLCEEILSLSTKSTSKSSNDSNSNESSMSYLSTMTRIELSDACLLRGLPIGKHITNDAMIESLQQHLQIVATIVLSFMTHRWYQPQEQQQRDINAFSSQLLISKHDIESIGLYMIYLPMIRDYLTQNNVSVSIPQK